MATGQSLGKPLAHHTEAVFATACTVLGGVPVAVSGSRDGTVRMWDMETGTPVGEPLAGLGSVTSLACTQARETPLAVVGGRAAGVWDLSTRRKLLKLADDYPAFAVACAMAGDRPIAVTCKKTRWEPYLGDSILQLWDLAALRAVGEPLVVPSDSANNMACTAVGGHVVAIATGMRATIQLWHPTDGQLLSELPAVDTLVTLACAVLDGTPIALSGGQSGIVRIWDLAARQLMGPPLIVHSGPVRSIECAVLDGKSVAVTTSKDQTVHLWDLRERATITTLTVDAPRTATITDSGELIIGFHNDIALLRRLPGSAKSTALTHIQW